MMQKKKNIVTKDKTENVAYFLNACDWLLITMLPSDTQLQYQQVTDTNVYLTCALSAFILAGSRGAPCL